MQDFAKLDAQRQLLGAINSTDPNVRQQAYTAAQAMGIDPTPFRQQAAAQAMPDLLKAMQPQFNPVQVTPKITAPGQYAQRQQAGDYSGPVESTPTLSDALSSVNSPELSAQMAPEIVKQSIETQQKSLRRLSPQEAVSAGYDVGDPVYQDAYGNVTSPVKPKAAINQAVDEKVLEAQRVPMTQAQIAANKIAQDRLNMDKEAANEAPDPDTVKYWAQSVAAGAPLPTLGMGKQAAAYRQAILKGAAQINMGKGLGGADQNAITGTTKANMASLSKITPLRAATESYENTMLQNMDAAQGMLTKGAGTTGIPVINRWQRYIKGEYGGDPDVSAFNTAVQTIKNEYAKIQSGSIGNTPVSDASRKEAEGMINPNMTPQQLLANFNYMKRETGNRARALRASESALRSGLSGKGDMPNVPGVTDPQATAAPTPSPMSLPRTPAPGRIRVYNPNTGRLE